MQKAASMASTACAIFLPNCANFWAVDAPVQLLFFGISTCTDCATVLFLGCAFAQLVQPAQFVAYVINTDGTTALSQTQNTKRDF